MARHEFGTGNQRAAKKVLTTDTPPWESWHGTRASRAIRFIETYCISPKGYGSGKPLVLADFQRDWLELVLENGISSAVMELPRGNGKSTLLAALALWALMDGDETGAPQVPIIATTINQAIRSTYGVALSMVNKCPTLKERALIYSAIGGMKIKTPHNEGECFPISSDPDGLQGLDPSLAIADEIGFLPIEAWDSLLLATGKRSRSLVVGIGTPGFDRRNALWHLRARSRSGDALPGFAFTEYAADEGCAVDDEEQWTKANPALAAGYMDVEALRSAVNLSPESSFRIFRLGQWVEGFTSWLGVDARKLWDSLEAPYEMEIGAPTWVGIDVGFRHDSTAIVWAQRSEPNSLHVKAKIWQPKGDDTLDVQDAMKHLRDLCTLYDVKQISYDARLFELAADELYNEGLPMVEVPQSLERMTPAVGQTYEAIKRSEISHDPDLAFSDHVLNAVARFNERGFTLSKSKSTSRIDAAVALCLAVHAALTQAPEPVKYNIY